LTATVEAADPLSANAPGITAHADSAGAPVQVNVINWLKPSTGETATAKFAVCPAETVADAGGTGAIEKSCPVPLRATVWVPLDALSVILNVPVRVPVAVGEKVTLMVQLDAAPKLPPQLSLSANSEAFVPLIPTFEMVKAELPVLLSVNTCAALDVPTA
jgi:hypothetical protein